MKNILASSIKVVLLGSAIGLLSPAAHATLSFTSATNTVGGASVSAQADISISGNIMTVKLTDLLADPSSVGSVLNGIQINISGVSGVSGLTADAATTVNLSGASPVYGSASGATVAGAYALSGSSTITLTALGGGQPKYLIIGPPGYASANGSLQNGAHNPFILDSETFYFTLSGTGPFLEDNISGITFLFGTGSDYSGSNQTPVPEPSTVVAGALLLLPLGVSAVRILRKQRTV